MKRLSICFSIAVFAALFYSQTLRAQSSIEVSDTIRADETLSADTVKITGNVVIIDDVTLTINPGTYIQFQGYYHMVILGTILAVGTPADTIVFSVADTTGFNDFE